MRIADCGIEERGERRAESGRNADCGLRNRREQRVESGEQRVQEGGVWYDFRPTEYFGRETHKPKTCI